MGERGDRCPRLSGGGRGRGRRRCRQQNARLVSDVTRAGDDVTREGDDIDSDRGFELALRPRAHGGWKEVAP
jgi:hypothetical protein